MPRSCRRSIADPYWSSSMKPMRRAAPPAAACCSIERMPASILSRADELAECTAIFGGFKPPNMAVHSANSSARDKMLAGIRSIEQHAAAGGAALRIGFIEEDQYGSAIDLLHDLGIHYNGAKAASRAEVQANFLENLVSPRSPVRLVVALANEGTVIGLVAVSSFQSFVNPSPAEREQLFVKEVYVLSSQRRRGVGE